MSESRGTKITIGGKDRYLRFDFNALAEIEERLDIKLRPGAIEEDLAQLAERPMRLASTGRLLLWAGLLHAEPDLTEQEVGSWVDFENVGEVMEGFFAQLPEMSEEAEGSVRAALGAETADQPKETVSA